MSRMYYRKYNILTTVPAIILASASGASLLGIGSSKECDNDIAVICLGICGIVSGVCMSINRFLQYPELQEQHDMYSDHFEILHNDIQLHMSIQNTPESVFRTNAELMKYCKYRLDILIDKAPPIPNAMTRKLGAI